MYKKIPLILLILLMNCIISCNSSKRINRDFNYFQRGLDSIPSYSFVEPKIKINDFLSIQVYSGSLSQDQTVLFNLQNFGGIGGIAGTGATVSSSSASSSGGYQIDTDGFITMPVIGKISAIKLTKHELAAIITQKLVPFVKEPSVIVKFQKFKINLLGDIRKTGALYLNTDKATVLDVIGEAGDLAESGRRDNVLLLREEDGKMNTYRFDLRDASIFKSPAFQVQQNDIIYVTTADRRLKTLYGDPNVQRDVALSFQILSAVAILLNIFSFFRR